MKKISLFLAIFFIALAGNITAQTDYGIRIAGVEVTSANCNNIKGTNISGSVSYNPGTATLTLNNATIDGNISFTSNVLYLTITLMGENTVTGGISDTKDTKTINGTGSLKVKYINCFNEKRTIIANCTLDINSNGTFGLNGNGTWGNTELTINNATLYVKAGEAAIGSFKNIELIDCEVLEPVNSQIIDNSIPTYYGKYICDGDGNIAKEVVIAVDYGIVVAGVYVNSINCNKITGSKISGSVSYNHATKTLTLNKVTLFNGSISFNDKVKDITITLVGNNIVNSIGTVYGTGSTKTINGNGSLKVKYIECSYEQETIIENCTIDVDAASVNFDWAMTGNNRNTLTIKNANLSVEAKQVAIGSFEDIELIGCTFVEPTNAQIIDNAYEDYGGKYICDAGGNIAKKVVIKKVTNYGITVAGVKVNSANCNSITGTKISGSVSYNHDTKTLTLDNATIGSGGIDFDNNVTDITITLVGENAVKGTIEDVKGTKTINGNGSLKVGEIHIWREYKAIIEDCTIDIMDITDLGLFGGNTILTIKNANLSAEANKVAIGYFDDIELIGCEIVEPVNAQIIDNEFNGIKSKYVCDADGNIAKKVVIKKKDSSVEGIVQTNSINIYPNPAKDFVTIEGKGEIKITNSLGQIVKEIKDNNTYRILNIKDFERGVYYIKVGNTTQKLVVE